MASIGSTTNSSNRINFTGMASGMDTQAIVEATLSAKKEAIINKEKKQQILEWKQEMYTDITNKLQSFQEKYMDVLSSNNMRSQKNYKVYDVTSKLASGENTSLVTVEGTTDGSAGTHSISIIQKATAATLSTKSGITKPIESNKLDVIKSNVNKLTSEESSFNIVLDGVAKTVSIKTEDMKNALSADSTGEEFAKVLQSAIDKQVGAGKIKVSIPENAEDGFTFTTSGGASQLTVSGADFLNLSSAVSNYISTGSTISEAIAKMDSDTKKIFTLESDGKYSITINGEKIEFSADASVNTVMKEVSANSKTGVTMSYDEIDDKFVFTASETGIASKIEIEGVEEDKWSFESGQDAKAFVDGKLLTRSTNTFTVNGVKYTINREPVEEEAALVYKDADGNVINKTQYERAANSTQEDDGSGTKIYKDGSGKEITEDEYNKNIAATVTQAETVGSKITTQLSIDVDKVYDNIKGFVDAYNELIESINGKLSEEYDSDYGPLTDDEKVAMSESTIESYEKKAKTGLLRNDEILSSLLSNLRTALYESIDGVSGGIYSIGITTSSNISDNGKLNIDETKLRDAIKEDPDRVMNIFSKTSTTAFSRTMSNEDRKKRNSEEGIANRFYDIFQDYISTYRDSGNNPGKLIAKAGKENTSWATNNTLYNEILSYKKSIVSMWEAYYDKEDALYDKYASLETAMNNLNSQTNSLTAMLG